MTAQEDPNSLEANVRYLLERCPFTVRSRYKGLDEDLVASLAITFLGMQHELMKIKGIKPTPVPPNEHF